MIKNGDKLLAKDKFLILNDIPEEYREFEVISHGGDCFELVNKNDFKYTFCGYETLIDEFYISGSINFEIRKLIEDKNIQFKSFNGVTLDGKVFQIRV